MNISIQAMLLICITLFAVAAAGGLVMAGVRAMSQRNPPPWLALLHGLLAGAGLTLLLLVYFVSDLPAAAAWALLLFIIAALGIAHFAGIRAPIIAMVGGTIAVIGGFGHAIFGATRLMQLPMAADTANYEVYASLIDGGMPLALMILMLCGTVGTVLGLILLGVALLRAKAGPRWVPYAIWLWVIVEFAGTSITEWASLASGLLYLGVFGTLAVAVWRSPLAVWASVASLTPEVSVPSSEAAVAL